MNSTANTPLSLYTYAQAKQHYLFILQLNMMAGIQESIQLQSTVPLRPNQLTKLP